MFTGHKITSYGGRLEFVQRYTERPNARYMLDQDVIIIGNGITIYWTNHILPQRNIANVREYEITSHLKITSFQCNCYSMRKVLYFELYS